MSHINSTRAPLASAKLSDAAACVHDPVSVRLLPIGRSGRRPHPSELGLRQHHLEARSGDAGLEHLVSNVHLRAKFDPIRASGEIRLTAGVEVTLIKYQ